VRVLSRLPQAENRGLLLLEGLAQVPVQDAKLGQLPVEPRDLVIPLLEGRLYPLKCDALLLEPALRLFLPRRSRLRVARDLARAVRSCWS
jgi:hypothetical protein